jgi:hypothetical protein
LANMPAKRLEGYTASLCRIAADGEVVPIEQTDLVANTDHAAIGEAARWAASRPDLVDEETRLVVKQGVRSICSDKVGQF